MSSLLTPYLRERRINVIKPYLKFNILDLGCGSALLSTYLNKNYSYTGIELNREYVKWLEKKYPIYKFYQCNIEVDKLPNFGKKFDTITMIAVIEHLKNPRNIFKQCHHLLNEEGNLIITTLLPIGNQIHRIGVNLGLTSKDAAERHYCLYSYQKMKELLQEVKFKIVVYEKFEFNLNQLFICKIQ
ncbi:class I SAM-dependent methyltransferase [candidate division WOR-3 bacterium]|nr:class I SAM-dependent methyltransferase [candidate division WOR-3 bacterium]